MWIRWNGEERRRGGMNRERRGRKEAGSALIGEPTSGSSFHRILRDEQSGQNRSQRKDCLSGNGEP